MHSFTMGLMLATATSLSNVVMDVTRKKALTGHDLLWTSFWIRFTVAAALTVVLAVRWLGGIVPAIRPDVTAASFSIGSSTHVSYLVYLLVDTALVGFGVLLYYRAIQISPLSLTIPFLAFTPVFLLLTGNLILGELPPLLKSEGVIFVVLGSLLMHRQAFRAGVLEPFRAVLRERGSRYMLAVSFILSLTNPLDKKLVLMSDAVFYAWAYAIMLLLFFGIPLALRRDATSSRAPLAIKWIPVTGLIDALTLLLQFQSHNYIDVVITITLKRAGIVLAVLAGWLIFHERQIADRLIASGVMIAGAAMIYLPLTLRQQMILSAVTLVGAAIALLLTRQEPSRHPAAAKVGSVNG
jgi:drug/metabolite transporter (DMT)-like permease